MIQRKTLSAPEQILDNLRSLVTDAEQMLSERGLPIGEEEVRQIKRRFENGIERLRDSYEDMSDRARAYWEEIEQNLRDYYDDVERQLTRKMRAAGRTIRRHPYQSMGIVFGLGVAIGAILGMRRW